VSGGEVTVPKLFVNNSTGKLGLVGYWDVIAFDEFAGKKKRPNKALVDIMKNYIANKSFSRGIETLGAEASMVFVGNTEHTLPYMLKHADLFDDLPEAYHDSEFLDRLHFYIPGWEVDIIRGEMFSSGYGFVVDYLAEILRTLRNHDFSQQYADRFQLLADISTRDRDAVNKTFSGLMEILFPHRESTEAEIEEVLRFAVEGRKRSKDQLLRLDQTYATVKFGFRRDGQKEPAMVQTIEEVQYSQHYQKDRSAEGSEESSPDIHDTEAAMESAPTATPTAQEQHLVFQENHRGVSYDGLFGPYLKGALEITITDPYIRLFYQARNLMEFLETVAKLKSDDEEITVHLLTVEDQFKGDQQKEYLMQMQESVWSAGITFISAIAVRRVRKMLLFFGSLNAARDPAGS